MITSTFFQFTSTVLLSDLSLQILPGDPVQTQNIYYDYIFDPTNTSTRGPYNYVETIGRFTLNKPLVNPTFAELNGAAVKQSGISDTGPTLRSFLPISSSGDRGILSRYAGKSTVLDLRVTCVQPNITNLIWDGTNYFIGAYPYLTGEIRPKLGLNLDHMNVPDTPVPFDCYGAKYVPDDNVMTICELANSGLLHDDGGYSGGLYSSFRNRNQTRAQNGGAYLITSFNPQVGPEWVSIPNPPSNFSGPYTGIELLWFTSCYTALDAVDRLIEATSSQNRTEPTPKWYGNTTYSQKDIIAQLIPSSIGNMTVEDRGILQLAPAEGESWVHPLSSELGGDGPIDLNELPSWATSAVELPWLINSLHWASGFYIGEGTVLVSEDTPQKTLQGCTGVQLWLKDMFYAFMRPENGGTAVALQSFFTVLASLQYYDRLPEYTKETSASITNFGAHLAARGPYRWDLNVNRSIEIDGFIVDAQFDKEYTWKGKIPPFFTLTLVFVVIHYFVVVSISFWFIKESKLTRLGDPWQAITQVTAGDQSSRLLEVSRSVHVDRQAAQMEIKKMGLDQTCVGIKQDTEGAVALEARRAKTQ